MSSVLAFISATTLLGGQNGIQSVNTVSQLNELLGTWGYSISPKNSTVEKAGILGRYYMNAMQGGPEARDVYSLSVQATLHKTEGTDDDEVMSWLNSRLAVPNLATEVHLDDTVSLFIQIGIPATKSIDEVHRELDQAWNVSIAIQNNLLQVARRRKRVKPLEDKTLHSLNQHDAWYLAHAWGWGFKKSWGGSSPGWISPATIDGIDVFLSAIPNHSPSDVSSQSVRNPNGPVQSVYLSTDIKIGVGINPGQKAQMIQKENPWARFVSNPTTHELYITKVVDFTKGMSVGQFKSVLLDFAHKVQRLSEPYR